MSSKHSAQRPVTNEILGDHLSTQPERRSPTGISVLVVGAGVGGIMTALECWRKGHDVRILEKSSGPIETGRLTPLRTYNKLAANIDNLGDFFTVGFSAIKAFRNWPRLLKENEELAYDPWIAYYKQTGEMVVPPGPVTWDAGAKEVNDRPERIYRHHRPKFYRMLLAQLERLGVQTEFNHRVVDYYEDTTVGKGGVVLDNGNKVEADIVVAADGLGTKSYNLVVGRKVAARSSGYAIYRTAYPVEYALVDS